MRNHTSKRQHHTRTAFAGGSNLTRAAALRELGQVLYATRQPDGIIKIGCTRNLSQRLAHVGGELLAFAPGTFEDEMALHRTLAGSAARGREWYHPTDAVMAVVNEWRAALRLPAA